MKKIIFAFRIGEKVRIKSTGRTGKVISYWVDRGELKRYEVEYADKNGAIFSRYFITEDLKR